jgi:hypothetical protein
LTEKWSERPIEEANLLNPGFLSLLVWSTALGYQNKSSSFMPYTMAFISLPVLLHKVTREVLPNKVSSNLTTWLQNNSVAKAGFADRAQSLCPFIRESILFGCVHGLINIQNSQIIPTVIKPKTLKDFTDDASDEVRECLKKSNFLGQWLAVSGNEITILSLWGVQP